MHSDNSETAFDTVVVRLGGEIGIKSAWTRRTYEKQLIGTIAATLRSQRIRFEAIIRQQGRIYIKTDYAHDAVFRLARVFGISSLSPAIQTAGRIDNIIAEAMSLAASELKAGSSFAVRCRRVGSHPYTSQDVCNQVGRKILEVYSDRQPWVNLNNPDITIGIEVRQNNAMIYLNEIPAPDGLPVGTQSPIIGLITPNPESYVASWLAMKRGCPLIPVYFDENPKKSVIGQVKRDCRALFEWSIGQPRSLYVVPFAEVRTMLGQECPQNLMNVISRRFIFRISSCIAEEEKAEAIVTGERIVERPHQTLRYLKLQDQASPDYPIHRPLIGLAKKEVRVLAEEIGIQPAPFRVIKKAGGERYRKKLLPTNEQVKAIESKLAIQEVAEAVKEEIEITAV